MYAQRYRKRGLEPVQKRLLEGIGQVPVDGASVLDVGCGIGTILLALLKDGAEKAVGVDMSEGMLSHARRFAEESGLAARVQFVEGDVTRLAQQIPVSDITVLDKVVCCYEDVGALVQTATSKTRRIIALSHPREHFVMRALVAGHTILTKLLGWGFHPFWHDWAEMRSQIVSEGFRLHYENTTFAWRVLVFHRL